jgi:hypothetical protein
MSKNHTFLVQTINAASYRIRRAATRDQDCRRDKQSLSGDLKLDLRKAP